MKRTNQTEPGFTLVETLIAVALVAILSSFVLINFNDARAEARDSKRQSDLQTIAQALELYKQRWGRYPEGCNGANVWAGQSGGSYQCSGGSARYIVGDPVAGRAFVPDYMQTLPVDPRLTGNNSGYIYRTNFEGTAYKLMASQTVETEVIRVQDQHQFKACDVTFTSTGVCDETYFAGNSTAPRCNNGTSYMTRSYALWSGFPDEPFATGARAEEQLENVICRMP